MSLWSEPGSMRTFPGVLPVPLRSDDRSDESRPGPDRNRAGRDAPGSTP